MSNKKCSDGCIFYCAKTTTVVKTLLETASLLSETMQFLRNCSEKVEYSLVKGKNVKAKEKQNLRQTFPLWRERGTSLWLVESRIHFVGM